MTDIAVIILVGKEEIHIKRCLEKLAPLEPRQIFVVESQEGDRTHEIAVETGKALGWKVDELGMMNEELGISGDSNPKLETRNSKLITIFHAWPGNQARQFDWSLDNLPIEAGWILRLDADEYLIDETVEKMVRSSDFRVSGSEDASKDGSADLYTLELKHTFMGGEIRHGTAGIRIPRLFKRGMARYGEAVMDERLKTTGTLADFDGAFYDDNLNTFEWWQEKHRGYAKREAQQALFGGFHDPRKAKYYKLPPYFRAFLYFCLRYFVKLGFLDGAAGFRWHFWQGLWYRWIVDMEIGKLKRMGK